MYLVIQQRLPSFGRGIEDSDGGVLSGTGKTNLVLDNMGKLLITRVDESNRHKAAWGTCMCT